VLLALLADEPAAAGVLGRLGRRVPQVEAGLLAALAEGPGRRRLAASGALAALGSAAGRAALAALLRHRRPRLRRQAAVCLGAFGGQAAAVLPDLLRTLADSHARVRRAAVETLAAWGAQATPALPLLVRRRADRAPRVRAAAEEALARLRPHLPGPARGWLRVLAAPGKSPGRNLRRLLARPDLPEGVRREFVAACLRRERWHAGHGAAAEASGPPPASAWEAARRAAGAAARAGGSRASEYAWLGACLWSLLAR
jgi:hypothetical protein